MATGIGIKSKAAFRLNKPDLNVYLSPTTNGALVTVYPTTAAVAATGASPVMSNINTIHSKLRFFNLTFISCTIYKCVREDNLTAVKSNCSIRKIWLPV